MNKGDLIKTLSEGIAIVTFTKKDGTERVMRCTRNPSFIPAEFHPKTSDEKENLEASDNIRVFDVEKQGWRSFNYSTVKV